MSRVVTLAALILCSGCATVINGRFQSLPVGSFPSGAHIAVECGDVPDDGGTTPAKVTLQRGAKHCILTLSRVGYADSEVVLRKERSRVTNANKVLAIPVGLITGAIAAIAGDAVLDDDGAMAEDGFRAGMEVAAAPGRQFDKHTGAAYKWVPGDVFVTLLREPTRTSPD